MQDLPIFGLNKPYITEVQPIGWQHYIVNITSFYKKTLLFSVIRRSLKAKLVNSADIVRMYCCISKIQNETR